MSKNENGSSFEVLQEVYKLVRDIDGTLKRLELRQAELENSSIENSEEIKQLKKDLDKALIRWQKLWNKNKNYVYLSIGLGFIGASATLGIDFVVEITKKFFGIK